MVGHRVKESGNVANIMVTGILMLAMTVLMMNFLDEISLIQQKAAVSQIARRYILCMETTGGLLAEDREALERELAGMDISEIDLSGTTFGENGYGEKIVLKIRGKLGGQYEFEETKASTAKY